MEFKKATKDKLNDENVKNFEFSAELKFLIGPYDMLSEMDSEDGELTECQICLTDFEPIGKCVPCKLKLPSQVMCPLCEKCWMASKVSFTL